MDPLSIGVALTTASKAFSILKMGIETGREIEDMTTQLGSWFGAMSDLSKAEQRSKKPPLFKKITNSKSVEQEAIDSVIAKQKALEMRKQVRELILFRYGMTVWQDLLHMEKKIREERRRAVYAQKERVEAFYNMVFVIGGILASVALIGGIIYLFTSVL